MRTNCYFTSDCLVSVLVIVCSYEWAGICILIISGINNPAQFLFHNEIFVIDLFLSSYFIELLYCVIPY